MVRPKALSVYSVTRSARSDQRTACCQSSPIARIVPRKGTITITRTKGLELPIGFIKPPTTELPGARSVRGTRKLPALVSQKHLQCLLFKRERYSNRSLLFDLQNRLPSSVYVLVKYLQPEASLV